MTTLTAACRHHATDRTAPPHGRAPEREPLRATDALEALYRNGRAGVLAYLLRQVGQEYASDLAQEVFVRAAGSGQLQDVRNPGGFLRCIARNVVIDFARRRRCRIVTLPIAGNIVAACDPEQEDHLHALDAEQLCRQALATLPFKTARVFAMSRFEHKSYREIQLELGIALSTVDYHMMKALAHLRQALARHDDPDRIN